MTFVAPAGYQPVYCPSIPYLGPIHGGLRDGTSIYIQGSVAEDVTRFVVNLLCGPSDSSDIALHFNPRFDGRDKVVFNSRVNGSWGSEEKTHSMPFSRGNAFEMVITISSQGYQFKVNGKEFFLLPHRISVERVRAIQITGDVSVQTVNVIGGGFPGSHLPVKPQQTSSLSVPYHTMIPGGMLPKRTVVIRGAVPYGATRMGINFVVSRTKDIAFHMNPRMKEGVVVRNSRSGGQWGPEERELSTNPFQEGQYFDVRNFLFSPSSWFLSSDRLFCLSGVDSLRKPGVQGVCERAALV
uniref:Galectin n=1 Tax=Nothobranchius furzeri TaxID=105023 RepID=A0A8C6LSF0_NOTFU